MADLNDVVRENARVRVGNRVTWGGHDLSEIENPANRGKAGRGTIGETSTVFTLLILLFV